MSTFRTDAVPTDELAFSYCQEGFEEMAERATPQEVADPELAALWPEVREAARRVEALRERLVAVFADRLGPNWES